MDKLRNLLPFHKRKDQETEISPDYFHENGALLMKDLIATFGPRYNLPVRSFTHEQIIKATNDFSEQVNAHDTGIFYRGSLEGRPVLVKRCSSYIGRDTPDHGVRDIVVTSQMSHHKNVLPLIGCCLWSKLPAMVYDDALDHQFVKELLLSPSGNGINGKVISWRNRIRIAKDVSSVLIYLHKAFPTPIIFRDLKVSRVVIDRYGVAKLVGFEHSICLPPGEVRAEDMVVGTFGYIDPEYLRSSFVTEKSDAYGMGALMLALFAGHFSGTIECARERSTSVDVDDEIRTPIRVAIGDCRHFTQDSRRFKQFIDSKIFEEDAQNEDQNKILEHLLALSNLALRCTQTKGENRPEMIDVAKQLSQMDKSVRS